MAGGLHSTVEEMEEDMNLIEHMMESCTILDRRSVSDGEGGLVTQFVDGATINAAITHDNTMQSRIAEHDGVTSTYTITTTRDIALSFHVVIRRNSDGQIFRVTSNGRDSRTPKVAGLDIAQVTAEAWTLPQGGSNE
jgi:head-tail adaptor